MGAACSCAPDSLGWASHERQLGVVPRVRLQLEVQEVRRGACPAPCFGFGGTRDHVWQARSQTANRVPILEGLTRASAHCRQEAKRMDVVHAAFLPLCFMQSSCSLSTVGTP